MNKIKPNSTSKKNEVIDEDDFKKYDFESLVNYFEFLLSDENWKNNLKKIQDLVSVFESK